MKKKKYPVGYIVELLRMSDGLKFYVIAIQFVV